MLHHTPAQRQRGFGRLSSAIFLRRAAEGIWNFSAGPS
jgi:hypothetical protein